MEITRKSCDTIRETVESNVKKALEDMGFVVSVGGVTFSQGVSARMTVTVSQKGAVADGMKDGPKIGDRYHFKGDDYTYERYDARKWKNPHILRNERNGKSYKFSDFALSVGKKL